MADDVHTVLEIAVEECDKLRIWLVREHCREEADAIAVAVAMMQQAEIIFRALGGGQMVAAQFYRAADRAIK